MTTTFSGPAKIYAFPARGRFAVAGPYASGQGGDSSASAANVQLPAGVKFAASGSGWYHDEAIQEAVEAEPRRKN
jgi:hypothetical protein